MQDRRPDEPLPHEPDSTRATGAGVLLVEDHLLEQRHVPAPVLPGPAHTEPAVVTHPHQRSAGVDQHALRPDLLQFSAADEVVCLGDRRSVEADHVGALEELPEKVREHLAKVPILIDTLPTEALVADGLERVAWGEGEIRVGIDRLLKILEAFTEFLGLQFPPVVNTF